MVGFALSAFLITLVASLGLGTLGLWLAVAAGAVGWGVGAWQLLRRGRPEASGSLLAGELLVGAALLRVAVQGTSFWRSSGSTSIFTQYRDLLYHLALVKSGIERGLPLRGWVLESGVPRPGYHPAFDTTASVLIEGLKLPVDAGFFRLILPLTLLAMLVGLAVLAGSWARSRRGGLLVLGFVGLTLIVAQLPDSVTAVIGDAGLNNLRYFLYNPPSTLSTVAATACLAIVALASERRATGAFVLAGLLAGATVMMKANFAIVLVPAFVLTLGLLALFHRRAWSTAVAGIAAAALASAAAYPTTLGPTGGALALSLGRLGPHLLLIAGGHSALHSYSALFTRLAGPLARHGQIGDALLVLLYVLVAPLGVWLLVTALASWRARAVGERPFGRSPTASLMVLVIVGLSIVAALVVAQRGFDYTQSWNITWHTIQNLWWLGLCAAAVAVDAALATVTNRHPATAQTVAATAGRPLSPWWQSPWPRRSCSPSRCTTSPRSARPARELYPATSKPSCRVVTLDVPVNARIVQRRYTRTYNWISALAGRGAVLERSSWTRLQYPARTAALEQGHRRALQHSRCGRRPAGGARRGCRVRGPSSRTRRRPRPSQDRHRGRTSRRLGAAPLAVNRVGRGRRSATIRGVGHLETHPGKEDEPACEPGQSRSGGTSPPALAPRWGPGRQAILAGPETAPLADEVQGPTAHLVVDAPDVLAQGAHRHELDAADEQHQHGQRGPALHRDVAEELGDHEHHRQQERARRDDQTEPGGEPQGAHGESHDPVQGEAHHARRAGTSSHRPGGGRVRTGRQPSHSRSRPPCRERSGRAPAC